MSPIRLVAIGSALGALSVAGAQSTSLLNETRAKSTAQTYANRLRLGFGLGRVETSTSTFHNAPPLVTSVSNDLMVILDGRDGALRGIFNLAREREIASRPRSGTKGRFAEPSQAWRRGREILKQAGVQEGAFVQTRLKSFPRSNTIADSHRDRVIMAFESRPFGYPTNGAGNSATVAIDGITGEVLRLRNDVGWSYAKPNIKVTTQQAIDLAKRVATIAGLGSFGSKPASSLSYALSDRSFGSPRGEQLRAQKQVRLAYSVDFGRAVVLIDSETGECLGGSLRKLKS